MTHKNITDSNIKNATNILMAKCYGQSNDMGWWKPGDLENPLVIPTKLCLIHSEISEAMEGDRKKSMDDHLPHRSMFEVELADALIRICDLAGACDLDLGGAVAEKLAYNLQRADHKLQNRQEEGGKTY